MAAFSKYFLKTVNVLDCSEIIHDGTCFESTLWNFTRTIDGCIKFVLPLAIVSDPICFGCVSPFNFGHLQLPIIMKIKKIDKKVLMQSLKIFIDYFLGAWLISGFGLSFICFFR